MQSLAAFLHESPALSLFLSILLGTIIGRFHFKGVGFGSVVGTLIAGIVIGILAKPELPDMLRWAFFYLFLFSIGYSVGPQFFGSLKKEAIPQIALAVVVAVSGLATVIAVSAAFGFDEGLAVGLLSGGMTQSAALGTGLSAIAELPIPEAAKATLIANAPLADAITYGFGDLGLILFLTWLGPKMMRADLKSEAKALERQLSGGRHGRPGLFRRALRSPGVPSSRTRRWPRRTSRRSRSATPTSGCRCSGCNAGRDLLTLDPALTLKPGDRLVVSARRGAFLHAERDIGPEIDDAALLSVPVKTVAVVVTSPRGERQDARRAGTGSERRAACTSSRSSAGPEADAARAVDGAGARRHPARSSARPTMSQRAGTHIGFVERDLAATDLTFLAGGICAGMLLGLLKINVGGHRPRTRHGGFDPGGRSRGRVGAQPLSGVRRDTGAGAAAADGHRSDRLHRGGRACTPDRTPSRPIATSGGTFFASIFVAGMIVTDGAARRRARSPRATC